MENVPVLIAALAAVAAVALVVTDVVRAHRSRPLFGPVHPPRQIGQHVGHDLSELWGFSQSNHTRIVTSVPEL